MVTFFADWSFEPSILIGIALAAVLYGVGLIYSSRQLGRRPRSWQIASYYVGLLVLLIALESPLDAAAETYLWAHMLQHELLVMVGAPLLLLGQPLMPMWRAVPLSLRRAALGWVVRQGWPRRVWHAISATVLTPVPIYIIFVAGFSVWHAPALYDAALASSTVHAFEHVTFLGTALLFWAQVIPTRPGHASLGLVGRTVYLAVAGVYSSIVGSIFMFSVAPFFPYYANLPRTADQMSALVDQHLAGAAMDVPGVIIFFIAMCTLIWLWLGEDQRAAAAETSAARPAGSRA